MSRLSVAIAAFLALVPATARAQAQADTAQTYLEFQVEQPVRVRTPAAPVYPAHLRSNRIEGQVLVQFVVDERGTPQMGTFKVLRSNDNAFTEAVKRAVNASSFHSATIGGRKVRTLVQQPYNFALRTS